MKVYDDKYTMKALYYNDIDNCDRGTGITTRQLAAAPLDAVFVWCNDDLSYPKMLVRQLEREDIKIVSPDWITDRRFEGQHLTALVVDHATHFSRKQWLAYYDARVYVRE